MGFTVPLVLSALGETASRFLNSNLLKGIGALTTALSLIDRAKGLSKDEKHQTKTIVRRLGEAVQARMERAGSEADRQAYLGAATSAEIVLEKLLKSKETLVQAARCDADVLLAYIDDNGGSAMRREVDQKAEGLFDDLLTIVADGLVGLAETSQDFLRNALLVALDNHDSLMGGQEAVLRLVQEHGQNLSMLRKALEEIREGASVGGELLARVSQALEIVAMRAKAEPVSEGQGRPIRFGSPPGRAAGFIDREEQAKLDAALGRPESRDRRDEALKPVCDIDAGRSVDGGGFSSDGDNAGSWSVGVPIVVCGMRGVGKSQLAAAYYRECEKSGWSLVAWMDASTREQAVAGLGGLAHEMGIDEDGKGDPEGLARRCVSRLNSGEGDRLLVFDNVEDIDDLAGLVPRSDGLRVLVTTTMARLDPGAGILVPVGMFTRPQSVAFVLERTGTGDPTSAARLAGALGDLPVALAQAAGTIEVNGYSTIDEYLAELSEYRLDEVVDRLPGDDYPVLVHAALRMACRSALDMLADKDRTSGQEGLPRAAAASVQLATLALLAPSGVPRPWLHRIGTRLPIARQSLGALVAHSICTSSQDGRYVRIHGLQGRVLREDYNKQPEVFASLEKAVVTLLENIDIDEASKNDAQRADALDMADHLRAIAEQQGQAHYSPHEARIDLSNVAGIINDTIYRLTDMGRPQTALTLEDAVDRLTDILGPDHPDTLRTRRSLATAHGQAGRLDKAIDMYEPLLTDQTRILGPDHPDTLRTRHNLATAHEEAGRLDKAIDMYEPLLTDQIRILGPDHPDTLRTRRSLATAHGQAGRLDKAIDMYEPLLTDQIRILRPDHPDTLRTRHNLATAHKEAGRLDKAIDMYQPLLTDQTRILGPDHPDTLRTRHNLATAHGQAGRLDKAIDMYQPLLTDQTRILGPDHPDTLRTRNNLATAHKEAGRLDKAIDMYETLLTDRTRILGPDHPDTLRTRRSLAGAHYAGGDLQTATNVYEALLDDLTRVLGPDHPHTLAISQFLSVLRDQGGGAEKNQQ